MNAPTLEAPALPVCLCCDLPIHDREVHALASDLIDDAETYRVRLCGECSRRAASKRAEVRP